MRMLAVFVGLALITGYSHRAGGNIRPPALKKSQKPRPVVKPPAPHKSLLEELPPGTKLQWVPYQDWMNGTPNIKK